MAAVSVIRLHGLKRRMQQARERLASGYLPSQYRSIFPVLIGVLQKTRLNVLDGKIKRGEDLSFEEAFCGMCHVVAATNARFFQTFQDDFRRLYDDDLSFERLQSLATAFLVLMATKEALKSITHDEIAGVVTATTMDVLAHFDVEKVIETGGMGGDRGLAQQGQNRKTINASTLSALVLSGLGLPAIKHGSYANTSKVGSTEAIEQLGVKATINSMSSFYRIWKRSGFCFFDAHLVKTVHDKSHELMMETINHVIGPMTSPIAKTTEINKVMGVNEKVHPETVAKAYTTLHRAGVQNVGGVVIIAGLDEDGKGIDPTDHRAVRTHSIVDEFSPYTSAVAVAYQDKYLGTFLVTPEDLGVHFRSDQILIENNVDAIYRANLSALSGKDTELADYLAANAAFGLYAFEYLHRPDAIVAGRLNAQHLRTCFARCRESIRAGNAQKVLNRHRRASNSWF